MDLIAFALFDPVYLCKVMNYYRRQIVAPDRVWHMWRGSQDYISWVDDNPRDAGWVKRVFGNN